MATVEGASSVGLIAKDEQVKAAEDAMKVTEIEPATKKALEEEAPASTPAEKVKAAEEKVDVEPTKGEASADEIGVVTTALEGESKSAQVESGVDQLLRLLGQVPHWPGESKSAQVKSGVDQLLRLLGQVPHWLETEVDGLLQAIEKVASSVGLIAEEEQVKGAEDAVKVTEIEPATEKALEEEAPASTPAEEVPATDEKVDDGPTTGEASVEEISVAPPALEGESESAQLEAAQVPEEADLAKEGFAAEAPAESAAVETAVEEKGEEILAKEETPAEVPEEKIASVEESAVEEAKPAEAVTVEEKTEGEVKAEE